VRLPPVLAAALLAALVSGGAALQQDRSVTLGLFIPTRGQEIPSGQEAFRGAEIAAARANRAGGIHSRPVRLVTASSDVPWSAATDALVRLIYDEGAVAIVGALDGRTAHLAEQVITRAKGQTVFVTPWASETTVTRIRIPWFFQMVPDDRRQGEVLAREIFQVRGIRSAAAWVEKGLDPQSAADAFEKYAPADAVSRFPAGDPAARQDLLARAGKGEFGAVILFAGSGAATDLVRSLSRNRSASPALFGPLALARREFLDGDSGRVAQGILLPGPESLRGTPAIEEFRREFQKTYGSLPTLVAAYSHDAVKALVEALRKLPAPESDGLAEALAGIRTNGVTGEIRFDKRLGREAVPILAQVKGSELVPLATEVPAGRR